jgi:SAM-dependent methyltransferase
MPNENMTAAWDGDEGAHWAANADRYDETVRAHHARLLEVAAIGAGEAVLDIGCGTGRTTRDAARAAGSGRTLGVDLSGPMLEVARDRAVSEGLTNVEFLQADAQVHRFEPGTFDVVISRFGVMFFDDPEAAFANIGRALRPGGRLAFVAWQGLERSEWIMVPGAAGRLTSACPKASLPTSRVPAHLPTLRAFSGSWTPPVSSTSLWTR